MRGHLRRLLFLATLAGAWAAASSLAASPQLPSPLAVARALSTGLVSGDLVASLARSLVRLTAGYGLSLLGGVALGFSTARSRALRDTVGSLVVGFQAVPSLCWLPLAVLWFGLSEKAILLVIVLGSMLSIAIATEAAVKSVAPLLVRAAQVMGARGTRLWFRVVLPAALPGILAGARIGWTFAWRSLLGAELLYATTGLGQVLQRGRQRNDTALLLAVMALIVALGLLCENIVFGRIEARVRRRWGTA